jgi:hypothetical protein
MNRRTFLVSSATLMLSMSARGADDASKLDVAVTYTGSGTVDESHKVYVVLWDSPDFMKGDAGGPPIGVQSVTAKSDVAHFDNLSKGPVYASMVYDPNGKWDAASPPPAGCSIGLYAKEPGTPTPIELNPGKTTKISASFDDSQKMQ